MYHLACGPLDAATTRGSSSASSRTSAHTWCSSSTGTAPASGCAGSSGGARRCAAEVGGGARLRPHRLPARGGRRPRLRRAGVRRRPRARAGESLQDVLGRDAAEAYLRGGAADLRRGPAGREARLAGPGRGPGRAHGLSAIGPAGAPRARAAPRRAQRRDRRGRPRCPRAGDPRRDGRRAGGGDARARAEHEADELVTEARTAAARAPELDPFLELIEAADDIADCVEEAAFYATLLPAGDPGGEVATPGAADRRLVLDGLAGVPSRGPAERRAQARRPTRGDGRVPGRRASGDRARARDRRDPARGPPGAGVPRRSRAALFVVVELTRSFEEAADALMHGAPPAARAHAGTSGRLRVGCRRRAARRPQRPRCPPDRSAGEHVYLLGDSSVPLPDAPRSAPRRTGWPGWRAPGCASRRPPS